MSTPVRETLAQKLALAVYSLLLWLIQPFYLLKLWRRSRVEPLYAHAIGERFGFYGAQAPLGGVRLWIHAVSLGETRAAAALIDALRIARPGVTLLLTHGTATGREAGTALLRAGDVQAWLPWDTPGAARRFVEHFKPAIGVLMETETWPNLLRAAECGGIAIVSANARLSERSLRRGLRLDALMRPAAQRVTLALAQTESDAARLRLAGAPQVEVSGNLKFDMTPDPAQLARGRAWRAALAGRSVVLATSTREGEEGPLLDAWRASPAPRPLLLIVPRHPQRFDEVAVAITTAGFSLTRRSAWHDNPPADAADMDVWLGDSMRELAVYYAFAQVALLGGSYAPLGGQNLIEAAACGCPIVMGPHTFNFAEAAELALGAGAALRVADFAQAVTTARSMLADPARLAQSAERATAFAAQHQGAAARMAERILTLTGKASAT